MDRLSSFDKMPSGMRNYFSSYGYHFSKKMCEWAVSMMQVETGDGKKKKLDSINNEQVKQILKNYNIELKNDKGYDACYVANMAKADYWGSSIAKEENLAKFIKDYLDDPDGYEGIAFCRFMADMDATGTPIIWEDMI